MRNLFWVFAVLFFIPGKGNGEIVPATLEKSEYRTRYCLNGEWDILAADSELANLTPSDLKQKGLEWGRIRTPGTYDSAYTTYRMRKEGENWCWLKGNFSLPDFSEGKRCMLTFEGIRYAHKIYINDQLLKIEPKSEFAPVIIDVSNFIRKDNEIYAVVSQPGWEMLSDGTWEKTSEGRDTCGISKDVYLEVTPKVAVEDVFVKPSVRQHKLIINLQIRNIDKNSRTVEIGNQVVDKGRTVKRSQLQKIEIMPGKTGKLIFEIPWKNPRYWSHEDPYLYHLETVIKENGNVVDIKRARFGFRELWFEKGDFYLNGAKTHLWAEGPAPISTSFPAQAKLAINVMKEANYNVARFHVNQCYNLSDWVFDLTDEMGLMVTYGPGNVWRDYLTRVAKGEIDLKTDPVANSARTLIRYYRNHPSLIIWESSNEVLSYHGGPGNKPWELLAKGLENWRKVILEEDDSRLIKDNGAGDVYFDPYIMNFHYPFQFDTPMEEREELLSIWAKDKKKAFMPGEFGVPARVYPGMTDFHASYIGPEAYNCSGKWGNPPGFFKQLSIHAKNVFRVWRFYGISGMETWGVLTGGRGLLACGCGLPEKPLNTPGASPIRFTWGSIFNPNPADKSTYYVPTPLFYALKDVLIPLLVHVGGDKDHPTWKEHSFFSKDTIRKSIIAINNHTYQIKPIIEWRIVDEFDRCYSEGKVELSILPGENVVHPLEFTAPEVFKKANFTIELKVLVNEKLYSEDKFNFQVWPKQPKITQKLNIALYDQWKITLENLKKAGISPNLVVSDDIDPLKYDLLIIGRESLDGIALSLIGKFLDQGKNAIVFEQNDEVELPRQLGTSVVKCNSRRVFIEAYSHPLLEGFGDEDFDYWQGESDLIKPAYEITEPDEKYYHILRLAGRFKCGNKGMVSSFSLTKPYNGNFRLLLSTGVGLKFSPVVEWWIGKGILLWCQLDISQRFGKDPVPTLIFNRLIEYALKEHPVDKKVAILSGNKEFIDFLTNNTTAKQEKDVLAADVIIFGDKFSKIQSEKWWYKEHLRGKGKDYIFWIDGMEEKDQLSEYLHFPLKIVEDKLSHVIVPKQYEPLFWGISSSDLCFDSKNPPQLFIPYTPYPLQEHCNYPAQSEVSSTLPSLILKVPYGDYGINRFIFVDFPASEMTNRNLQRAFSTLFTNIGIRHKDSLEAVKIFTLPKRGEYFSIDISKHCNMEFKDDMANDRTGGWTDQGGGKDLKYFPTGRQTFCGVPFDIVEPQKNDGKACVVLYGGGGQQDSRVYFPKSAEGIKIDQNVNRLHFTIAVAYCYQFKKEVGYFKINYSDGSTAKIPLIATVNITDWAYSPSPLPEAKPAWISPVPPGVVYYYCWDNPDPEKKIISLDFFSHGNPKMADIPILIAITGEKPLE